MKKTTKRTLRLLVLLGLLTGLLLGLVTTTYAAGNKVNTKAQAKKIALNKANVKSSSVKKWTKVMLDSWDDDGDKEWDVEFKTKTWQYEVEINARTGAVEDYEQKRISSVKTAKISEKKARSIALERAGVAASDVTKWTKIKLDKKEWEFKFQTADRKFEVEINAKTGAVKDFEVKEIKPAATTKITEAEAKSIALEHAKSNASFSGDPSYTKVKLDREHGTDVYEIEFRCGMLEFEYEINADTGAIIEWDYDYDD